MLSHHERSNMAISKSGLPKAVLELFDPRHDLEYKAPIEKKKPALPLLGIAGYVGHFPGPEDPEYAPERPELATRDDRQFRNSEYHLQVALAEPSVPERRAARKQEHEEAYKNKLEAALASYDPKADPNAGDSDPMKCLFVARLDYSTTEEQLRSEFEKHGPIRSIKLVRDSQGKSRGYAFIEYEHSGDMKKAYKAYPDEGRVRIPGSSRWSVVDCERGRTVSEWKPMRLGGGKGGRPPREKKAKGAAALQGGPGGPPMRGAPPGGPRDMMDRTPMEARGGYGGRDDRNGGAPGPPARYGDRGSEPPRPGGGDRYGGRDGGRDRYGGGYDRDRYGGGGAGDRGMEDRGRDRYGGGGSRERDRGDRYGGDRHGGDRYGARNGTSDRYGGRDGGADRYGGKRERDHSRDYDRGPPRDRDYKRSRYDERDRGR